MKVLVAGKGGVGKTTLSALLADVLASKGYNVLALDTDSVPNLAQSLGIPYEKALDIVPLSRNEELAEERTGARPGSGWGILFSLTPRVDDLVYRYGIRIRPNLSLVVVGSIEQPKEGCLCPSIALARAFLTHVLLREKDVVIGMAVNVLIAFAIIQLYRTHGSVDVRSLGKSLDPTRGDEE